MRQLYVSIILIVVILAAAIWINVPNSGIHIGKFNRSLETILGLDLQGGMQVLLEVPEGIAVDSQQLQDAKSILENRANGLGVSEVVFQVAGNRRIVGEFPGLTNTADVIATLKETGQLEFVDVGENFFPEGTILKTDLGGDATSSTEVQPDQAATPVDAVTATPEATDAAQAEGAGTATPTETPLTDQVYHTIMTGDQLESVAVSTNQVSQIVVDFKLKSEGTKIFADHTANNTGKYLALVLDKKVVSCPRINTAIEKGEGYIEGSFTVESANQLAVQLRYGSLPIPLTVLETRVIGPTLGQDSLTKSLIAGGIGLIIVALFMLIYYRLPGLVAIISIASYGVITLALYKLIPITLTLAGIAGLLLSLGGALDANILIFERLKEELRSGRRLDVALSLGWKRAWPSIRDSNIATIITSLILFWFGSQYGASTVKGFAVTLALGVLLTLFTALVTTRTFLNLVMSNFKPKNLERWFGL